eukprot:gene11516-13435_t
MALFMLLNYILVLPGRQQESSGDGAKNKLVGAKGGDANVGVKVGRPDDGQFTFSHVEEDPEGNALPPAHRTDGRANELPVEKTYNEHSNHKPHNHHEELFKVTIEPPNARWTWDRPEISHCHYSNKRDYIKEPLSFQFNHFRDPLCDVPCVPDAKGGKYDATTRNKKDKCTSSVYFTMENAPTSEDYDIIATVNLDSDVPLPMFGWNQYTYAEKPAPKDSTNQGLVSAFISNCSPTKRLEWMSRLQTAGVTVDSYGICQKNKEIVRRGDATDYNGIKLDIARTYKFTLAFENSNAEDYVTEKLFGPLAIGTVPIYDGPHNQKKFAPNNHSVIFASDFETPEKLAEYLKYLDKNDEEYQKYLEWKKIGPTRDWTAMVDVARIGCECRVCIAAADLQRKQVGMNFGDSDHRKKYIKVPKDWNESKGIDYEGLKRIVVDNIPHNGELYSLKDIESKRILVSDNLESSTINLRQEQELEVIFVDMQFYFSNTPKPKHHH